MGFLSVLRITRRGAASERAGEPPVAVPRGVSARSRTLAAAVVAAGDALDGLKNLERRHGAAVAPAAVRLRSAVLLHRAGHKAEAWEAFERLLADPSLGGPPAVRPIVQSEIYSRMRMALEREGCQPAAVTPAALAYATRTQFYAVQGRRAELDALRTAACCDRYFLPLLERARLVPMLPALRALMTEHLQSLPELDLAALAAALEALRQKPASAAPRRKADR